MMKATLSLAALLISTAALAPGALAGSCMKVTGHGTGVTEPVAKFMSEAAVKNGIASRGLKAAGDLKTSCKTDALVISNCTSSQRAC